MIDFPTVDAYALPDALRNPLRSNTDPPIRREEAAPQSLLPDAEALSAALTPLISTAIARRVRQRRFA